MTRVRPGRSLLPLRATGTITRRATSFHLALQLVRDEKPQTAEFESETCPPLGKAASLVLALAFGEGVELDLEDQLETPAVANAESLEPVPVQDAAGRERDAGQLMKQPGLPARRLKVTPWASAVASSGFVGATGWGVEVGLGARGRSWSAFMRASAFPPARVASRHDVSAHLSALSATAAVCAGNDWPTLRIDGCLGFDAGAVRAHSSGAAREGDATAPWYALSPAVFALLPVSRPFALRAELAVLLPLATPRYDVAPHGTLYATSQLVPRGSVGVAIEL